MFQCEDVLAQEGVTDLEHYACMRGTSVTG
jgi:hypothetical protein